ncbi:MAG: bifunctional diaminohydroxyphosphoribosylaminopyrimidine deaminase/5-amino-6-(5-phosphoribosylamino)uracil reductase RibD [Chloroflexi bacterium]|nr:bifunctional diaminohydroxyphosphoribosylaminopyrimidine deaminase/5-amino-6-(5-phosphoribosylamino)uracil reductase RibD [Chloroflexota bacterium]
MKGALTLAKLALGYTSPNPAVGSVIVKDGMVVGMGHTQPPGSWHAEVMALQQAGSKANKGTMYVTLEPCCHYGRTPPCTEAIISAGIEEVHIAIADPNPIVNGKGISALQAAGIKVVLGEMAGPATEVNEAYIKHITTGVPFVTAKVAMSLDGKIATKTGDSKWISGDDARKFVHGMRHTADAIMVGVNTVIHDDPRLTARLSSGKGGTAKVQPLRVIVDGKGRTPASARVFNEPGKTLLAVCRPVGSAQIEAYARNGGEVLQLPSQEEQGDMVDLRALLKELGKREVTHLLVEGGGTLIGSLFDAGLIDKLVIFIAPIIIGGSNAKPAVAGRGVDRIAQAFALQRMEVKRFGDDIMVSGYPSGRVS